VKRRAATAAMLLAVSLPAARVGARTFRETFERPITRPIGDALAASIGRSLPLTAASAGITFSFDKETQVFERETDILGQVFLERPRPLGRGKWNLSASYQWVRIDTLDGRDLDALSDTRFPIIDPRNGRPFTVPRFGLDLATHQVTTSLTYGATADLDLNLTVPVLYSTFESRVIFRDAATGREQRAHVRASSTGVGDLFLRGKQRFAHGRWGDVAAGLVLRVPTGNEDDFQGTGAWEVAPMLYAATPSVAVGSRVRVQAYANGGIDVDAGDVERSEGRLGIGVDGAVAERLTVAVAVLGREPFAGIAPPGFFDVTRVDPRTGRRFRAPVLGFDRGRANPYDLSLGGRVDLWRDTVFGFVNVLLPLDRAGFRSDVIPLIGLEAAF